MKRIFFWIAFLGNISILSCNAKQEAKNGANKAQSIKVDAFIVSTSDINNSIEINGEILAWEEVEITTEMAGRIEDILFEEGSFVQKGQLLIKINDEDIKARFVQAAAKLSMEEKSLERLKKLIASGGVSQQEIDETESRVEDLKGEKLFLQSQLNKTEIRAPWPGKIGIRSISKGAVIAMGTSVATLRQVNPVKIEFKIPERYVGSVKKGNEFTLKTDYLRNEEIVGVVDLIEPGVDRTTRSVVLRGKVNNQSEKLVPGTSARIHLFLETIKGGIMIPDRAIKPVIKGKEIVIIKNGKAKFISVESGIRNENFVEVRGELQAGDTIVTTGLMQLKEGMTVEILSIEK